MHSGLLAEVNKIRERARKLGLAVFITPTLNEDSVVISNDRTDKVILLGMTQISGIDTLTAYSVNPYKWQWARDEGFSKKEIMTEKKLSKQIFTEILVDEVANSLI